MESKILSARINDTADIAYKSSAPKFLGFLSAEEAVFAAQVMLKKNVKHSFFGGFDSAQRVVLGCFPDWADSFDFPIVPITFRYRKEDNLSHRDFLGTLMGLGLKREAVGDILTEEKRAVIFVLSDIADFVLSEVKKVGRTGVTTEKGYTAPLPQSATLADFTITVASNRLDCIVSAVANISRTEATDKINLGFVSVNSFVTEKITKPITDGDILSIRGKGKFIIDSLSDKTKKGRTVLKYKKYV